MEGFSVSEALNALREAAAVEEPAIVVEELAVEADEAPAPMEVQNPPNQVVRNLFYKLFKKRP